MVRARTRLVDWCSRWRVVGSFHAKGCSVAAGRVKCCSTYQMTSYHMLHSCDTSNPQRWLRRISARGFNCLFWISSSCWWHSSGTAATTVSLDSHTPLCLSWAWQSLGRGSLACGWTWALGCSLVGGCWLLNGSSISPPDLWALLVMEAHKSPTWAQPRLPTASYPFCDKATETWSCSE